MTLDRRQFCSSIGAATLSLATIPAISAMPVLTNRPKAKQLNVIAYNVLKCTGWPADRANAKKAVATGQIARRMALELALYDPDIINFSESPSEAIAKEIAGYLGMNHVRFPSAGAWPGTILSKYEIAESSNVPMERERPRNLFTRHWGRAVVQLPWEEKLIVHSAHLYPGSDPTTRLEEIPAMLEVMKGDIESGSSVILMGDLNHKPETQEYKLWQEAGWIDTFTKAGRGDGLTMDAAKGRSRIDYIMAAGPISERIQESRALFEGAFRVNQADPADFALSDHVPQFAAFSGT